MQLFDTLPRRRVKRRHLPGWATVEVCHRTLLTVALGDVGTSLSALHTECHPYLPVPPTGTAAPESPRLPGPPFPGGGGTNP